MGEKNSPQPRKSEKMRINVCYFPAGRSEPLTKVLKVLLEAGTVFFTKRIDLAIEWQYTRVHHLMLSFQSLSRPLH